MEKILLNNRNELSKAYDFFGAKNRDRINQVLREFPCVLIGEYSEDIEFGSGYNFSSVTLNDFNSNSGEIIRD